MKIIRSRRTGDGWDVLVEEGVTHVLLHFISEPQPIEITDCFASILAAKKAEVPAEDPQRKVALVEAKLGVADAVLMFYAADKSAVGDKAREYFAAMNPVAKEMIP